MAPAPRSLRLLVIALALLGPLLIGSISHAAPPELDPSPTPTEAPRISEPPPAPTLAPTVVAPSCPADDSLSLTGSNLWEGLRDKPIVLTLKNGNDLTGSVVEQSSEQLAFARASDGAVVAVPKGDVAGIRLRATPVAPRGSLEGGRGHKTGGILLMTFGSMLGVSGIVMLGLCPECLYIHLPLLLPGGGMIGGGVALWKAGKRKQAAYERSWGMTARVRIAPSFAIHREGGHAGVVLRF